MTRRLALIVLPLAFAIFGVVIGAMRGLAIGERRARSSLATARHDAVVLHGVVTRAGVGVDLYLPVPSDNPAPWMVFAHERGWPPLTRRSAPASPSPAPCSDAASPSRSSGST